MAVSVTAVVVGTVVVQRALSLIDLKRCRAALDVLRTGMVPVAVSPVPDQGAGSTEANTMPPAMEPLSGLRPAVDGPVPAPSGDPVAALSREPSYGVPHSGRRNSGVILAMVAAVAGTLALALGTWSFVTLTRDDEPARAERIDRLVEQAVALLANPATQRIPFDGANGGLTIVITSEGDALLVITGLRAVPAGKTYQAWVIDKSGKPQPAGVFSGRSRIVKLERRVPLGATVAITLEREGGAAAPTQTPTLVARRT